MGIKEARGRGKGTTRAVPLRWSLMPAARELVQLEALLTWEYDPALQLLAWDQRRGPAILCLPPTSHWSMDQKPRTEIKNCPIAYRVIDTLAAQPSVS